MPEITTLPNGLRVITQSMTDTQSVTVNFFVGAGGRYENMKTEYGVSHFIEHLLFKGTHKRPSAKQISEEIDSVGGYINAYTMEDHTSFYIKLPKNYFGLAFNVLSDVLTDPLFEQAEIDLERGIVLEEMKVFQDDPGRLVFDLTGDLLWPNSTLRTNVIGTEQIISSMSRDTIKNYFENLYTMDNIVISVAGNITHKQVVDIAYELLADVHTKANRTWQPATGGISQVFTNFLYEDTNQAHIVLVGRAPQIDAADEAAMRVLTTILGGGPSSRLFLNVRENQGLAYTVYMGFSNFLDSGKFEIYAGVNVEKVNDAMAAIHKELEEIQHTVVDAQELNKAKEQVRGRFIMGLEGNAAVAEMIGTEMILNGKVESMQETLHKIDSVTAEQILEVAQTYLQKDMIRLAMIGPYQPEKIQDFKKIMEIT